MATYPKNCRWISSCFGKAMKAHQALGEQLVAAGPLKRKQAHLVELAAVPAALSWAREIIEKKS